MPLKMTAVELFNQVMIARQEFTDHGEIGWYRLVKIDFDNWVDERTSEIDLNRDYVKALYTTTVLSSWGSEVNNIS